MTGETAREDVRTNRAVARCCPVGTLAKCTLRWGVVALRYISAGVLGLTAASTCGMCAGTATASWVALAMTSDMAKAVTVVALGRQGAETLCSE